MAQRQTVSDVGSEAHPAPGSPILCGSESAEVLFDDFSCTIREELKKHAAGRTSGPTLRSHDSIAQHHLVVFVLQDVTMEYVFAGE